MLTSDGREWLIDATGCLPERLRDSTRMYELMTQIIRELQLNPIGQPLWHIFEREGGITGMFLLSESHLTVHTFPEYGLATFNLYCCRPRSEWNWSEHLHHQLGATHICVRSMVRGLSTVLESNNIQDSTTLKKV